MGVFKTSVTCCVFLHALFLSLPPFLSVYKRSSSDGPVPYAGQARGIRMAGDPGNGDLQYPKPAAPVHRLRQLCAQVGSGHTRVHSRAAEMQYLEELFKGLFIQRCCSKISLVMFVQSCLLMLDIDEKCGVPVPIRAVEIHHSLSALQSGCCARTAECTVCTEAFIVQHNCSCVLFF